MGLSLTASHISQFPTTTNKGAVMPSVRERVERKQAARIKELEAEVAALKAQVAALSAYSPYVPYAPAYGWYCGCGAWVLHGSTHQCTRGAPYYCVLTMGSNTGPAVTWN